MQRIAATIASGQTASSEIKNGHLAVLLIEFPTMTGTSATLTGSNDGFATSGVLGSEFVSASIASPSTRFVQPPLALAIGCTSFKIVSGTAEAEARTIYVTLHDYAG